MALALCDTCGKEHKCERTLNQVKVLVRKEQNKRRVKNCQVVKYVCRAFSEKEQPRRNCTFRELTVSLVLLSDSDCGTAGDSRHFFPMCSSRLNRYG